MITIVNKKCSQQQTFFYFPELKKNPKTNHILKLSFMLLELEFYVTTKSMTVTLVIVLKF